RICTWAALCVLATALDAPASAAPDPASLFTKKCSGCHTFGRGDRVGPDLKGVTDRRARAWLLSWIRSSQRMIDTHDPTARSLFEKYRRERMPDQNLSPDEIGALIDYLAAGGPLAAAAHARHASTATAADLAYGRDLFVGLRPTAAGGAPCSSCHVVREGSTSLGASFAGDLTHIYSRFQDTALSDFLRRPCFPRELATGEPLNEREAFAVKAYLRQVDLSAQRADKGSGGRW